MCRLDHVDPLRHIQFDPLDLVTDPVVQDLGRGTRQSVQPCVLQHPQIVRQGQARQLDTIDDFHGRECMRVHCGGGAFYSPQDVSVIERLHPPGQSSLHANLASAPFPGFLGPATHFLQRQEICILLTRRPAECAEAAAYEAYIGEVYVAVDYVGHYIADSLVPYAVCGQDQGFQFKSASLGEQEALVESNLKAIKRSLQRRCDVRVDHAEQRFEPAELLPTYVYVVRWIHVTSSRRDRKSSSGSAVGSAGSLRLTGRPESPNPSRASAAASAGSQSDLAS